MTFPTHVGSTVVYASGTTIAYPSGIQEGDLMLCVLPAVSSFSGWTRVHDGTFDVFAKSAVGTESGNLTTPSASGKALMVLRGADVDDFHVTEVNNGTVDVPNPGSLTPAGGADDYIWLVYGFSSTAGRFTTPTAPTDFTMGASTGDVAVAWRQLNASTLDPDAFGDADALTSTMYALTIAVGPSAAEASSFNPLFFFGTF